MYTTIPRSPRAAATLAAKSAGEVECLSRAQKRMQKRKEKSRAKRAVAH